VRIKSGPRSPFRRSIFRWRFRRGACRFSPGVEYSFLGPPRSRNDARAHSLRKQRPLKPIGSAAHAVTSTRRVMHPRVKELMSIRGSTRLADDCLRVKCRTSSRAVGVALVPESPWQPANIPAHAGMNSWWSHREPFGTDRRPASCSCRDPAAIGSDARLPKQWPRLCENSARAENE
jgi:hypothetical protein